MFDYCSLCYFWGIENEINIVSIIVKSENRNLPLCLMWYLIIYKCILVCLHPSYKYSRVTCKNQVEECNCLIAAIRLVCEKLMFNSTWEKMLNKLIILILIIELRCQIQMFEIKRDWYKGIRNPTTFFIIIFSSHLH